MNKKKRVLIFSTAYFPYIGGAEIAVKEITDRINDTEFVMVTPLLDKKLPREEKLHNLYIHRIGKGNNWDKFRLFFCGPGYAKKLGKFDTVWSIMASFAGLTGLRYKKQNSDTKFLLTLQEGDSKKHIYSRAWFIWPYFKQIFKTADKIQAISKYLANWARELGAKCGIEIIPNGVSMALAKSGDEIVKKCNHKVVVTVSRLVEKNDIESLIKSAEFLPEDVHFSIVGSGEKELDLRDLVKSRGWTSRVHFVGNVEPHKVYGYLQQADVFCRPSLSEGLGNAFLEAMATGLPTIGTKVGGIPDFLVDEEISLPDEARRAKTGWFCEIKNPKSIAERVKYIIDDKNKSEVDKVIFNAKKMVEEKYSWNLIAQRMSKIFNELNV